MPDRAATFLLTCLGLGRAPWAPGTFGSIVPPLAALLLLWLGAPAVGVDCAMLLLAALASAVCLRLGGAAERLFRRKDPSQVVADEVAGQALALLLLPWRDASAPESLRWNAGLAVAAFVLFRLFDIAKPPPIGGVQRVEGGVGILIDDLIAGVFAAVALHAALLVAGSRGWMVAAG